MLLRIAANRNIRRETEDFRKEDLDNWPSILVAVSNSEDTQIVAVQRRQSAFAYPSTPAKVIENSVNHGLVKHGLRAYFEPLFEETAFWDLVRENRTRISRLTFELVTPNMANISGNLDQEMKSLAKSTNTALTELSLEADPKGVLDVDRTNTKLANLVDYASKGGGDVVLKVRGIKKVFRAQKTVKEIEVDQISLSGDPKTVVKILQEIIEKL
jgi:hypothetical protein